MSTQDSSAFRGKVGKDGDRDILFNGPGDGGTHGHVVESRHSTPKATRYRYAKDVEGNEYIDDKRGFGSYGGPQVPPTPGNPNGYDQSRY